MSRLNSLLASIDVVCPYCDAVVEIEDIDVSVTIEGCDIMRHSSEGVFETECPECNKNFILTSQLDIGVAKKPAQVS